MLKRFPWLSLTVARAACPTDGPSFSASSAPSRAIGSWRYDRESAPVRSQLMPIVFTAAAHGALLFGFMDSAPTIENVVSVPDDVSDWPAPPQALPDEVVIDLTKPPVADVRATDFVPTQPDVLSVPIKNEITQTFNPVPVTPRPAVTSLSTIPVGHGPGVDGVTDGSVTIFSPDMLDQAPRATFQPAPRFPAEMRRQVTQATVLVEFIVNARGSVEQARVVDATYRGFEAAAVDGVSRWRFKPGVKGGQAVNTRLRVPLVFTVSDR